MRLLRLMWLEAARRPWSTLPIVALALLGTAAILLSQALGNHLALASRLALAGSADERTLTIRAPASPDLISREAPRLSAADLSFLNGLAGRQALRVLQGVPLPATIEFKLGKVIDCNQFLAVYGLDLDTVPPEAVAAWKRTEGAVPLLINPQVVTMYNLGLADRYHLPRIRGEVLQQLTGRLVVGRDPFHELPKVETIPAYVAGYSTDVPTWGVAVPQQRAAAWLRELAPHTEAGPVEVHLRFQDQPALAAARAAIKERGLLVEGENLIAATIARAQHLLTLAIRGLALLLAGVLAILGALAASALVAERRRSLAHYRLHGAGTLHLLTICGGGVVAAGILGALVGGVLAHLIHPGLASRLALALLGPDLPLPPPLGLPSPGLILAPMLTAAVLLLAIAPLAWHEAHRDLLSDLREE